MKVIRKLHTPSLDKTHTASDTDREIATPTFQPNLLIQIPFVILNLLPYLTRTKPRESTEIDADLFPVKNRWQELNSRSQAVLLSPILVS